MNAGLPFAVLGFAGCVALIVMGLRTINNRILFSHGSRLRNTLTASAGNPVMSLVAGAGAAATFHSISGLGVLLMSLIEASLIGSGGAMMVITGALAGQILPLWILAVIGFSGPLAYWALPFLAVAIPVSLARRRPLARAGEGLTGFLFVLLGISLLRLTFPATSELRGLLLTVRSFGTLPVLFALAGFLTGIGVSFLTQSALAVMVVVYYLGWSGWLPLAPLLAMMLGSNVGIALTFHRAGGVYGRDSRAFVTAFILRLLTGTLVGLVLLIFFEYLVVSLFVDSFYKAELLPLFVAGVHTLYTIVTSLIMIPLNGVFIRLGRVMPRRHSPVREDDLPMLPRGVPDSLEANLITSRHVLASMAQRTHRMLLEILNVSQQLEGLEETAGRIKGFQEELAGEERRLTRFFTELIREPSGTDQARDIWAQNRIARELLRIGESCIDITSVLEKIERKKTRFHRDAVHELSSYIAKVLDFLKYDSDFLGRKLSTYDRSLALQMERNLIQDRNELQNRVRKVLSKDDSADIRGELQFIEIVRYLEDAGECCLRIGEEIGGLR